MKEEILDSDHHPLRKYTHRLGYSFSRWQRLVCSVFLLISVSMILGVPHFGIPLSLFFVFALTSRYGFQIDGPKGRCRSYSSAFWIKRGEWKNLADFPFVSVLVSRKGETTASMSNRTVTNTSEFYEIYLLCETHRTKMQVAEFTEESDAMGFAKEFAVINELNLVRYNPAVSAQTRSKR